MLQNLQELKQIAGRSKGGDSATIYAVGKHRFEVRRSGARHTGGGDGVFFEFNLVGGGCQFQLARRPIAAGVSPNVYVVVGSCRLMEVGHEQAWAEAVEVIGALGGLVERAVVSRIDLCADLPGQDVAPFVRAMLRGNVIRKASKWKPYFVGVDGTTGFETGTDLKLRVYDKVKETEHDPIKRELLTRIRWGGVVPETATRVEFCVRRDTMREKSFTDVADTFSKLPALAEWLTHDWFRMVRGVDRANEHQSRARVHKLWRTVRECFAWTGQGGGGLVKRTCRPDPQKLIDGGLGHFTSAAAMEGMVITDMAALEAYVLEKLRRVNIKALAEAQERKFTKLESLYPGLADGGSAVPF